MIDPSGIKFKDLPFVAIEDRHRLPDLPCIYFAIDSEDKVQYIGRASSAKKRWRSHHRRKQLEQIGGIRIMYLEVSEASLLPSIESALIEYFSPFLNRAIVPDPPRAVRSHLRKDGRPSCGSSSSSFLTSAAFLISENRCQKCDRIAQKLPSTAGRKKIEGRYPIVLSGLTPDALNWLDQLAAEGKVGETIGGLVNEKALRRN